MLSYFNAIINYNIDRIKILHAPIFIDHHEIVQDNDHSTARPRFFVVADDPASAEKKLVDRLVENGYARFKVHQVEFIAEEMNFIDTRGYRHVLVI